MREVTKMSHEGRIVLGSESEQFLSRLKHMREFLSVSGS
jgi:hypothetical protein